MDENPQSPNEVYPRLIAMVMVAVVVVTGERAVPTNPNLPRVES